MLASELIFLAFIAATSAGAAPQLSLGDGDRILFLGGGLVENDQGHAYLETRLQRRLPKLSFRYLGWSGDTVRGAARTAGFQVPQGLARLEKETLALRPSVIFLAYGMNESFDGLEALPGFLEDYDKLLKTLAPLKARLVILSPTYHEDLGRPFPDPIEHNKHLRAYSAALRDFARERRLLYVDLFLPLESAKKAHPALRLTTNGILLTQVGYALAAQAAEEQLAFPPQHWEVALDWSGKITKAAGTRLALVRAGAALRFQATDVLLPLANPAEAYKLSVTGLAAGNYQLSIDGQEIMSAAAATWQSGVTFTKGPMFAAGEELRAALVLRNQLFYRRWRPYNDHSRHWGFIGGDFKLYDQEIATHEDRIQELRRPRPLTFEVARLASPK